MLISSQDHDIDLFPDDQSVNIIAKNRFTQLKRHQCQDSDLAGETLCFMLHSGKFEGQVYAPFK